MTLAWPKTPPLLSFPVGRFTPKCLPPHSSSVLGRCRESGCCCDSLVARALGMAGCFPEKLFSRGVAGRLKEPYH